LGGWREALREALGPNGQLMVDLMPELKLLTGEQPPVPELPPQDAQRRFQLVFRRFLAVFARSEHPLALFLDDPQWLDAATLELLGDLLTQPEVQYLLVIGAYRDNEVDAAHPLTSSLEREQVAELNLIAGTRAKAATAYASALNYLANGGALLPEDSWERCYRLVFAIEINRAECEFLTTYREAAEARLAILSLRAANLIDKAAVASLRIGLYTSLDRCDRAVEICLE
jgi:predicted ATPase